MWVDEQDATMVARFEVDADDEWSLLGGPWDKFTWAKLKKQLLGEKREAEAAKLIQSGWRRKEAFAKVHEERRKKAEAAGVLLAMPGTVQGKTGYYQDPCSRLIAYFEVNEQVCCLVLQPFDPPLHRAVCCSLVQGEWRPAGARIELEDWRRAVLTAIVVQPEC
jgi:hypothetical protein